jgi:hypothetical protein
MLTRIAMKFDRVSKCLNENTQRIEHEHEHEEELEHSDAAEDLERPFLTRAESAPRPRLIARLLAAI